MLQPRLTIPAAGVEPAMKLTRNLGPTMRVLYVVAGVVLVVLSVVGPVRGTLALLVGLLGGISVVEGAIGY